MSDFQTIKISQLDTAASLNLSDEFPVNNGGGTKKGTLQKASDAMGLTDHLADDDAHRLINDAGTAGTDLWSAEKISVELANRAAASHTHAMSDLTGVLPVTKGGTGLNVLSAGVLLYTPNANEVGQCTPGTGLVLDGNNLNVVENTTNQKVNLKIEGVNVGTRKAINIINGGGMTIDGDDNGTDDRVDLTLTATANPVVATRQTVLAGSVDSNGAANFISVGTGLAVNIDATSPSLVLSFAKGFNANGAIEYMKEVSADFSIGSLTASTTCYLYAAYDPDTDSLSYGHSTLAPVYSLTAPSSPATGQHWFDISTMTMKRYNGGGWDTVTRVFLGEAITGAATVSSVITYSLAGVYRVPSFAIAVQTNYTKNHNIGVGSPWLNFQAWFYDGSTWCHHSLGAEYYVNATSNAGIGIRAVTATSLSFRTGYTALYTAWSTSSVVNISSGDMILLVRRGF